ncbi:MAG: hypothetical protein ACM3YO_01620 [Bacteroidota bacterium]
MGRETFVEKIYGSYFGDFLVTFGLITPDQLKEALRIQQEESPKLRIGEILVKQGHLTNAQLIEALREQRLQIRLGEFLINQGSLGFLQLLDALDEQRKTGHPLGKVLVEQGFTTEEEVRAALDAQKRYLDELEKKP